jgi:BlaI family transcriptional regulator, penicillinase repressor
MSKRLMRSKSKRGGAKGLTGLELEIMHVLWSHGRANVKLVQNHLRDRRAYTTVQTMLNILWKKRRVRRILLGRAYEYVPSIHLEDVLASEIERVLDQMLCGSTEKLVVALLKNQLISLTSLKELVDAIIASSPEVQP